MVALLPRTVVVLVDVLMVTDACSPPLEDRLEHDVVPQLTFGQDIKLNLRSVLPSLAMHLPYRHRTLPYVRDQRGEVVVRSYSARRLRFKSAPPPTALADANRLTEQRMDPCDNEVGWFA